MTLPLTTWEMTTAATVWTTAAPVTPKTATTRVRTTRAPTMATTPDRATQVQITRFRYALARYSTSEWATGLLQPVAHSSYRLDVFRAELRAQVSHVDIHDVGSGVEVVPPHPAEQLFAAENAIRVSHQFFGERELPR